MGQSTNAILAYGYDLGGGDDGWKIHQAGEYGELPELDWYDAENEEGDDLMSAGERRLRAEIAGFTEQWHSGNEGYFDRERDADASVGVKIESYCSGEYPMWLLATKIITVYRGDCKTIDMAELAEAPHIQGWDARLAAASQALGITPTQDRPRWLVFPFYG